MTTIDSGDLILVGAVAVAHGFQMGMIAHRVGNIRRKYKISPPTMEGPPEFIRALRAQQNSLEFSVPFEIVLWVAGLYSHPVPSALLGALYVYSRRNYINGYIQDAEKRVKPFWMGIRCLQGLTLLAVAGLANAALKRYVDVDVISVLRQKFF